MGRLVERGEEHLRVEALEQPRGRRPFVCGASGLERRYWEDDECPPSQWRWLWPRAASDEQRYWEEVARKGHAVQRAHHERRAAQHRVAQHATLKVHRLWNPHAAHRMRATNIPMLHRRPTLASAEPAPPFARVLVHVPVHARASVMAELGTLDDAAEAPAAPAAVDPAIFVHGAAGARREAAQTRAPPRSAYFLRANADGMQTDAGEPSFVDYERPGRDALAKLRVLAMQNGTTFCTAEAANPLHFFEQAVRCYHCGRQRFVTSRACTCEGGWRVHDDILPNDMLDVLTTRGGLSKASLAANELVRMCSLALPRGATRENHPNGGHLRITGVPFRIVDHLLEGSNARTFMHDPQRTAIADHYDKRCVPIRMISISAPRVTRQSMPDLGLGAGHAAAKRSWT